VVVEEGATEERLEPKCWQGTTLERLEPKCLERLEPKCLDSEPFTAAQHSEINMIFTNTFAGFIDQIIGKVQHMITNELQTSFEPVRCDFRNQIEMLRNEIVIELAPVQIGMKRYSFKHKSDNSHDQNKSTLGHSSDNQSVDTPSCCGPLHDLHVSNLDILHVDDE